VALFLSLSAKGFIKLECGSFDVRLHKGLVWKTNKQGA
jgi:hypothetical protein